MITQRREENNMKVEFNFADSIKDAMINSQKKELFDFLSDRFVGRAYNASIEAAIKSEIEYFLARNGYEDGGVTVRPIG